METIKKQLKDIEDMIPYRFNFDFGKKEYTGSSTNDSRPVYEISEMLGKKGIRWRISPTLELIVRYRHILFQDGRTYVVGKDKREIIDIISLFEYLQTTRNYAIFNNLLNVMLIFIIDYVLDIVKSDGITSTYLIDNYINEHYRKLYRIDNEGRVILVNSFIYGIEKKGDNPDLIQVELLDWDWNTSFYELLENLRKRRQTRTQQELSSSSSPEKDTKILLNNLKKHIDELEYNMAVGHKLILSLQYQFIIDNIHDYADAYDKPRHFETKVIYERDNVDIILRDRDGLVKDVSDDVINDELRKELKSWMSPKSRFIREATDSENRAALNAYALYVSENEKRRRIGQQRVSDKEENAYCNYAEAVSYNSTRIYLSNTSILHSTTYTVPVWMNYNIYMSKIKEEEETKAKEFAIAKKHESLRARLNNIYKKKTKSKQQFGGVDPGTLILLGSMGTYKLYQVREQARVNHPLYKGSNRVYIYPSLSTVTSIITTKLFKKKLNIQILYSSQTKILHISYNQDLPKAYNTVSIVTGNTRSTNKVMRGTKGKHKSINVLDRTLLFDNKHILKELYTNIKKYIDGRSVKVSPPKSSSSSHFGSIGSPPKS
jgi:hypothetical protein